MEYSRIVFGFNPMDPTLPDPVSTGKSALFQLYNIITPYLNRDFIQKYYDVKGVVPVEDIVLIEENLKFVMSLHNHPLVSVVIRHLPPDHFIVLTSAFRLAEANIRCSLRYQRILEFRRNAGIDIRGEFAIIRSLHDDAASEVFDIENEIPSPLSRDMCRATMSRTKRILEVAT